jgi:hypothetical protein
MIIKHRARVTITSPEEGGRVNDGVRRRGGFRGLLLDGVVWIVWMREVVGRERLFCNKRCRLILLPSRECYNRRDYNREVDYRRNRSRFRGI